ncbi:hypothetical protein [Alishewanella tabrizica]|uniref:Uncharacterized protein n=1 Tax=Alishewanella tabrizica TaxID=671278 RepID=A0ABQ2WKG4_9ALTE|nr:hypothetical protein [Alishewanella tabrizica]GGW55923.1 hypothetical protein GCM10008111_10120 [Alishewanella tabrizica]
MFDSSFRQQAAAWQQQFRMRQQGSVLQRLLAWLLLGVILLIGAFFLLFALVLSWVLIPIILYRHRRRMRQFRQFRQHAAHAQSHASARSDQLGAIIEGEVLHKEEHERR